MFERRTRKPEQDRRSRGFHPLRFLWRMFKRASTIIGAILLFSVLISLLASNPAVKQEELPQKLILVLQLKDGLTEEPMDGSLLESIQNFGEPHQTVQAIITTLDRAATDKRVAGIAFNIKGGEFGTANVQEIRAAVKRFRASGKPAWAYSPSYEEAGGTMGAYYLAAAFDQIWMQPVGFVGLPGYDAEMPFVADALKKIGLQPQFFQRKEYKSVMENMSRADMSPENREMTTSLLTDITATMVREIAADRKLLPENISRDIDIGVFTDKEALAARLVDRVDYSDVLVSTMRQSLGAKLDDEKSVPLVEFADYQATEPEKHTGPKVGIISAIGEIIADDNGGGIGKTVVTPEKISEAFQSAIDDKDVKAVVFRIASPGGSPTASETIRRAVQKTVAAGKPVIVSMGSMAGSGGYWIATDATRIYALPATLTGSIGVAGGKMDFSELMKKLEVNWDGVQIGKNADMYSMTKPFSESGTERMNAVMDSIYAAFIDRVAKGRKLTPETVEKIAKGRVWTGSQGLANGLVDELGGMDAALDHVAKLLGVANRSGLDIVELPKPKSTFGQIMDLMNIKTAMGWISHVAMDFISEKVKQASVVKVRTFDPVLNQKL
ncbi:MAG: signal peptide peptidase SppA, type [Micavibrio sp.]|nr:signal peptide peptidase SppA, type [Micavibrio sp.]